MGVVLGRWGGGGPWFGGLGGCPCGWWCLCLFYVAVSRARGVPPPLGDGRVFLLVLIYFGVGHVGLLSRKKKKKKKKRTRVAAFQEGATNPSDGGSLGVSHLDYCGFY
jgi:hypothetical protein